jgi:hypothetical protein
VRGLEEDLGRDTVEESVSSGFVYPYEPRRDAISPVVRVVVACPIFVWFPPVVP